MVNIMKYILGVQGVDEAVHIGALSFELIPDECKTQKMCNEAMGENPAYFFLYLTLLKHKRCVKKLSKTVRGIYNMSQVILRHKRCATKQWTGAYTYCSMSLIVL